MTSKSRHKILSLLSLASLSPNKKYGPITCSKRTAHHMATLYRWGGDNGEQHRLVTLRVSFHLSERGNSCHIVNKFLKEFTVLMSNDFIFHKS